MKLRRLGAVVGSLAAATALAACGSSSGSDIKTAAFTPLTKANFGTAVSDQMKGVTSAHMTLKASIMNFSADFSYGPPLEMQMSGTVTAQGRTMSLSVRMVNLVMYMQIPGQTPAGKYMALDLSKFPPTSKLFGMLDQYRKMGPQSMLSQFKNGVGSLRYVGTAQVDGQTARHYTVVVNTAAAMKALGNSSLLSQVSIPKTITEEVYLDAHHAPLRMVMSLPDPVGSMQIDFSKWGEPVHVVAPPKSQIINIPLSALDTSA
ncbi:MAG: hypothetical protein ACTHJM_02490 [Marmoricola sp.]